MLIGAQMLDSALWFLLGGIYYTLSPRPSTVMEELRDSVHASLPKIDVTCWVMVVIDRFSHSNVRPHETYIHCTYDHISTNLPEAKSGTNYLKKVGFLV